MIELVGAHWHPLVEVVLGKGSLDKNQFKLTSVKDWKPSSTVKTVIPLGNPALEKVLSETGIMRWRGRVAKNNHNQWVVPTLSPYDLLPQKGKAGEKDPKRFIGVMVMDIRRGIKVNLEGFTRGKANYLLDPTVYEWDNWVDKTLADPTWKKLSVDIETPYKVKEAENEEDLEEKKQLIGEKVPIIRISFSVRGYTGTSIPHMPGYRKGIARLLQDPRAKVVWNGIIFDIPVLQDTEYEVVGPVWDGMDMFHFYQSNLPKGLEWATSFHTDLLPWKHLSDSSPALYNAIDADAALREVEGLEDQLKHEGRLGTFINHYVRLSPPLVRSGKNGAKIDRVVQEELRSELLLEVERISTSLPELPDEVKPYDLYKKPPKDGWDTTIKIPGKGKFCGNCGEQFTSKSLHQKGKGNPCKGADTKVKAVEVDAYKKFGKFNLNSTTQLLGYMRFMGHPIGKNKKDAQKEAADKGHLKKLAKLTKDPLYKLALEAHQVGKTLGTYVNGFAPDLEGLIHTIYTNSPTTPRLGSRAVNLQNVGKKEDNPWAMRARDQIVSKNGILVQADSSAIEAVMQGYYMDDMDYIDVATKGVHSWLCCKQLGWEFNEESISKIKKDHKGLYDKMKVVNYLTNFGGSAKMAYLSFEGLFATVKDAEETQGMLYAMLPKLKEFHDQIRFNAQKQGFLELPGWKHRHYYYDVYKKDSNGKIILGKDAKKVAAFYPQGSAAAFMRDNILLIAYGDQACEWIGIPPLGLGDGLPWEWLPAVLVVHDGYTIDCPTSKKEMVADYLVKVLTRPIPQLDGLLVGCEVDFGLNWGKGMKGVRKVVVDNRTKKVYNA